MTRRERLEIREAIRLLHLDDGAGWGDGMDILWRLTGQAPTAKRCAIDDLKPVPFCDVSGMDTALVFGKGGDAT